MSNRPETRMDKGLEAGAGIEPANSGFADRCLTTWLSRHKRTRGRNEGGILARKFRMKREKAELGSIYRADFF